MNPLYNGFVYVVWFVSTYYVVALMLSLVWERRRLYDLRSADELPRVSVIVPAYNEEEGITQTIESLRRLDYPDFEVLVLDDGSTDGTAERALEAIGSDPRFVFSKNPHNLGKAATLNRGIDLSSGAIIATMDADSIVDPDVLVKAVPYFADPQVGAVTVSVRVANTNTLLNKLFDIEFLIGLSLLLKVLSFHRAIFVTPGPFSLYRRSTVESIGGFDPSNLTEDLEIAYRINKAGFRIENALEAEVRTNLPETWSGTYVQRRRWYAGALQTLTKHRSMLLRRRYGLFSFVIPFNYAIIGAGIALFLSSLWLLGSNLWRSLLTFRYTGLNIAQRLGQMSLDPLRIGTVSLTGILGIAATLVMLWLGLAFGRSKTRIKTPGIIGYPLLFFLYQIFWIGAIVAFVSRRALRWR